MGKRVIFLIVFIAGARGNVMSQDTFTLHEAIDYAMQHHVKLENDRLDAENAKWQYKEALAVGIPKVNGKVNYTYYYQRPITPTADFLSPAIYGILFQEDVLEPRELGEPEIFEFSFVQKNQLAFGIGVNALLFDGNYLKGLKASKLFIELAEKQIELTQQEIIHNVTRAYQSVLVAKRNIAILDSNIDNIQKTLRETQLTYENGFIEELDVDRIRVSLENLQIERDKLLQVIELSKNVLKYQMAYPVGKDITVTGDLEMIVEKLLLSPIEFINTIDHEKRPEHRLLVDAIALDEADLIRIKQGYLPSVSASFGYDQILQRDNLFDGNEAGLLPNGSVGIKANIPIYDGGRTKSKIEQKKIELEKRRNELSEFDRAMGLQVQNAFIDFNNKRWTLERTKEALALSQKIFDKTQIKYREGVGSSVELSQAERQLYSAQASYINGLYDVLTAKTELDIASGDILTKRGKN